MFGFLFIRLTRTCAMKSFKIIETQNRLMSKVFYSSFQFELAIDRESFEKQSYSCQGDLVILQYATETTECVVFGYVVKLQKVAIGSSDDYNPNLRNYHNNHNLISSQLNFFNMVIYRKIVLQYKLKSQLSNW